MTLDLFIRVRSLATFALASSSFVVLVALASPLDAQSADTSALRRNPVSMIGLPGLVQVPIAAATPSGTVDFTFDDARTPSVFPNLLRQRNAFIVFGFLPWLTVSARGTMAPFTTGEVERRDLSANVQLLLLHEHESTPAVALGVQDVGQGATPFFATRYLVASKTFLGMSTVTVGYGTGAHFLSRLFGGIGVGLGPWTTALGEYDGHGLNGGVRVFPFPSLSDQIGIQPRIDVVWGHGTGTAVGVGLRTTLGGKGAAHPLSAPTPSSRRAAAPPPTTSVRDTGVQGSTRPDYAIAAERRLVGLGFENVRVAIQSSDAGSVMAVNYENRLFNRDELDALGVVMGVTALHAPPAVRRMRVTIRRVDVPVMTVESDISAFVAFVNDRLSESSFSGQLAFLDMPSAAAADAGAAQRANPSRLKLDVFLRPRVETEEMTDLGAFDYRVTALADAYLQLGRGLVLNGRRGIPVTQTKTYWAPVEDPNADRLLLHQALPLPLAARWPMASAITQFSVGRFAHEAVGVSNETDLSLADGRVSVGSVLAVFGTTFASLDHTVALGTVRLRHPGLDLTTSLTAGRFRNGDSGVAAEVARRFGATDLAFFVRATDLAKVAGVSVGLPLAPAREMAPTLLRLRAPDLYVQAMQAQVFDPVPIVRRDVGRLLDTDHELTRVYRTRDRLRQVTVVAHVSTLREAARRWLGADILEH